MKKEDFYDLAASLEEACGDWESAEGFSTEAKAALLEKVATLDWEQSKEETKKVTTFKVKKRYLLVLAAALVMLMGMGVVGDRAWISEKDDLEMSSEVTPKINNEDKESILAEEEEVYREIAETLGIAVPRFGYYPEGMVIDSYMIMEGTGWAYVNYLYEGKTLYIHMTKNHREVSGNVQWDGSYEKMETITSMHGYEIEVYYVDEAEQKYGAKILYGNGYYEIFGCFSEKNEFFSILEQLFFKNV